MPLIYTLGIPALLVLGYLQGMRWRYVARERRNGRRPGTTPWIFAGMLVAGLVLIVLVYQSLS